MVGMLKEQKEQDAVLNRIGKLLLDLQTHNTTAAISIFQLPPDAIDICKGGDEWKNNGGGTPAYFVEMKKPPYCVGPYKLGEMKPIKDHLVGVQFWIRVDDAMLITSDGLLSVLAPILLPQEINPREQKVASRLLDIVLKQKDKNRKSKKTKKSDNWSRFLRLRGAWNDQDEAKGWVDDQNMLDFSWNDVKNPTRFGVDFGQSMEPEEVRKEKDNAKYWWIDIPDLTGLVLKILPTLERQREKQLKIRGVEPKPARSVGKSRELGGGAAEALEAPTTYTEEVDLNLFKMSSVKALVDIEGWTRVDAKQYVEDNGASIKSLKKALKKASHK
jgi:hypothetical protein